MNSERIVMAAYKPVQGKEAALKELIKTHIEILRKEGLVTDRKPIIMQAEDGSLVEIFGWKSKQAMEAAHHNPRVLEMWEKFNQVCMYIPIGNLDETQKMFSEFSPFN